MAETNPDVVGRRCAEDVEGLSWRASSQIGDHLPGAEDGESSVAGVPELGRCAEGDAEDGRTGLEADSRHRANQASRILSNCFLAVAETSTWRLPFSVTRMILDPGRRTALTLAGLTAADVPVPPLPMLTARLSRIRDLFTARGGSPRRALAFARVTSDSHSSPWGPARGGAAKVGRRPPPAARGVCLHLGRHPSR